MNRKIPYYVVKGKQGYWQPTKAMRGAGWGAVRCGEDGPAAWAVAAEWAERYRRSRLEPDAPAGPAPGTIAEAFAIYRRTPEWPKKALRTREEWERAWAHLKPFHNSRPALVGMDHLSKFRAKLADKISEREAHRTIKIWRALWQVMAALKYCDGDKDPSFGVRNTEPQRRQAVWTEGEVARLVKGAWRMGFKALAAIIAIAWDTSFSPVDARMLTLAQGYQDDAGVRFDVDRAKTGRAAVGTLGKRAERALRGYVADMGVTLLPNAPIFRTRDIAPGPKGGRPRTGVPYKNKDLLAKDFRKVRLAVFGHAETRTLADFRRSGTVEAMRGGASVEMLSHKLANDIKTNTNLQKTYAPVDVATVRQADEARRKGRFSRAKREQKLEIFQQTPVLPVGSQKERSGK